MAKVSYGFRFEASDVTAWKAAAKLIGLTLSEWMRRTLNASGELTKVIDGQGGPVEDAAQPRDASLAERGTGAPERSYGRSAPTRSRLRSRGRGADKPERAESGRCPHGMTRIGGVTMCQKCKRKGTK